MAQYGVQGKHGIPIATIKQGTSYFPDQSCRLQTSNRFVVVVAGLGWANLRVVLGSKKSWRPMTNQALK